MIRDSWKGWNMIRDSWKGLDWSSLVTAEDAGMVFPPISCNGAGAAAGMEQLRNFRNKTYVTDANSMSCVKSMGLSIHLIQSGD